MEIVMGRLVGCPPRRTEANTGTPDHTPVPGHHVDPRPRSRRTWYDCWLFRTPTCAFYFSVGTINFLCFFILFYSLWPLITGKPVFGEPKTMLNLNIHKRYMFTGPTPSMYAWKPRRTWTDGCSKGVNLTVMEGQNATMEIDFCSRTSCPNPNSLMWPDFYMCVSPVYQFCPKCRFWRDAWWTSNQLDWGNGAGEDLKSRIKIRKATAGENRGPQLMFQIKESKQSTDQGFFVICAYISGQDLCVVIFLAVPPASNETPSSPSAAMFIPLSVSTYHPVLPEADDTQLQGPAVVAGNRWYEVLRQLVGVAGINTSCYACTLFPKDNLGAMPVKPHPLSKEQVACSLLGLTPPFQQKNDLWYQTRHDLPSECSAFRNITIRVSTGQKLKTKEMDLFAPLGSVHPTHMNIMHPVCVKRGLTIQRVFLGHTKGYLNVYNLWDASSQPHPLPGSIQAWTAFSTKQTYISYSNHAI